MGEYEEEDYIPVPRKVRRHGARTEPDTMTPFQENLVRAMVESSTPTLPRAELSGSHQFYLSIAKMADELSSRGQAELRKKVFQAFSDQVFAEMEEAP